MAGKKAIAYPIKLKFVTRMPYFFNGAKDKYDLHKDEIDNILHLLEGEYQVGYVKRKRKFPHGINANSLNEAIREKLKLIPGIEGETNVVFGSFLPPVSGKGEFDFSRYDKLTNFYRLWNYCYGTNAARNGQEIFDQYVRSPKTKQDWEMFIEVQRPKKYEEELVVPSDVFNIIGEIQFGNWAMVYKDMFRLVSAINKKAEIGLYIYIVAADNLKKLMSDGVVSLNDAYRRFKENIENHNITKPVMIVPLDLGFNVNEYDFSSAEAGYEYVCEQIRKLEEIILKNKIKLKQCQNALKERKNETEKIKKKISKINNENKKYGDELLALKNSYKNQEEIEEE